MKKITEVKVNKTKISSKANKINLTIAGDNEAVFSLQIKDASSPNKFYNFTTNAFTSTFTSENTLSNRVISGSFNQLFNLPASSNGNTYTFYVFTYPEFSTEISSLLNLNKNLHTVEVTQGSNVRVRFSTSSDQTAASFVGLGEFTNNDSTDIIANDSSNSLTKRNISISKTLADAGDGLALGYKYTLSSSTDNYNSLADLLQPKDGDFFTKVTGQTNGSGTDSTSMILDSVDGLVIGMSLVDIADSSDEEQSGSLGVLTYPTITAINADTKTITLSAAPDWGDDKAVVFRAYGSELMSESTGGLFSFDLTVTPVTALNNKIDNFGKAVVNGAVSASTSIAIDGINGISVGSKIIGSGVTTSSNANLITAVHASGTPITVTGAQTLTDNTELRVYGSSSYGLIEGTMTISVFPTSDTDVFYDIDRAFIVATNS